MIAYAAAAAGTMVFFFIENTFSDLEFSARQSHLAERLETLSTRFDALDQRFIEFETGRESVLRTPTPNEEETVQQTDSASPSRLDMLEDSTAVLRGDLDALRSVLNPTDPDVLTVLRLGDKFELLTNELDSIGADIDDTSQSVDQRIQQSYESTTKHVDALTSTIGWMALLLVPILLNAVRDFLPRSSHHPEDPKPW